MSFPQYPRYTDVPEGWIGSIPIHWRLSPGRRLFANPRDNAEPEAVQLAATQKFGVIPQTLFMEQNEQKVVLALSGTSNFRKVQKNDFVISLRSFQGGIEMSAYEGCVSPAYTVLRHRHGSAGISPNYFRYLFKDTAYISALQSVTTGIREGRTITYDQFGSILLPVPEVEEQIQIARFLDHETAKIDALIAEQQRLIELLKEKRQAVISHAVTKGLDPNVPMKDSGVEWLGEVPAHWEITRIGWKCMVGNGCTPARDNQEYWKDGSFPWLNSSQVNLDRVNDADQFVTARALQVCALPVVKPGSVLMAITGEGKTRGTVTITEIEATISQHVAFMEPTDEYLSSSYLHSWLSACYSRLRFESAGWGSTKAAITCSDIRSFPLPLPTRTEQLEICCFVESQSSRFDVLTIDAKRSISLLEERRSALISAAVTGKIDVRMWQPSAQRTIP